MSDLDRETERTLRAIIAVLDVAASNFPSDTDIISAEGKNTAAVRLPEYELRALLAREPKP